MRAKRRVRPTIWARTERHVTLFLAPEAGLTPFYATHAVLARLLGDAGHAALILSCRGILPTCSFKMSMGGRVTASGNRNDYACVECRSCRSEVGGNYSLTDISLETILDRERRAQIDEILKQNDEAPWLTVHDDVDFGAACSGETMRARGKDNLDELDNDDLALMRGLLHSALCIYLAVKALTKQFRIVRIVYFGDYAYFLPAQLFAKRNNIALTHISHAYNRDIDRRYVSLIPGYSFAWIREQFDRWSQFRSTPISEAVVEKIFEGAVYRLHGHGGVSTFSPNWSFSQRGLLQELGLDLNRRTIVAFASSSDEIVCVSEFMRFFRTPFGAAPRPFEDQVDWLRAVSNWLAKRDDLQFVIRLHPRMAPNARSAGARHQYAKLKGALANLPANTTVVGAESRLSSYNIAELADVALVAWSSMGLELARFGVPVIAAFPEFAAYPIDGFIKSEAVSEQYFAALDTILLRMPSLSSIIDAFRWTYFSQWSHLVDLSDLVPKADYHQVPQYSTPRNADKILKVLVDRADIVELNTKKLMRNEVVARLEWAAVVRVLERLIIYLMTGTLVEQSPGIRVSLRSLDDNRRNDGEAVLQLEDSRQVSLVLNDEIHRRYSPLVHRLGLVLARSHE